MTKITLFYRANLFVLLLIISYLAFLPNYDNLPQVVSISDVINHFAAFFTLSFFLYKGFNTTIVKLFLILSIYGLFIETVQYFLPNRVFSLEDIFVDLVGVIVFVILLKIKKSVWGINKCQILR